MHPDRCSRLPESLAAASALALALAAAAPRPLHALGEESFGNGPVAAQEDWAAGVADVASSPARVYRRWVNGNESFYFRGKVEDLNAALKAFTAVRSEVREVLIVPAVGVTRTFDGTPVACDWELHVPSGIYLGMAKQETGTRALARHARLIIYAGSRNVDLDRLSIPPGVTVLGIEDRIRLCVEGMKGANDQVAGQAAYLLGECGAAIEEVEPLLEALEHRSDHVRACASGALRSLGKRAAPALPRLRALESSAHPNYRDGYRQAIEAIENARETAEADKARGELLARRDRIRKLIDGLAAKEKKGKNARDGTDAKAKE